MAKQNNNKSVPEVISALPKVEIFIKEPEKEAKKLTRKPKHEGMQFDYSFAKEGVHPFEQIEWEHRSSKISDEKGNVISGQEDVEVPKAWSQLATDILVSKYFRKAGLADGKGETSARQVVSRIAKAIRKAGEQEDYFQDKSDADAFEMDLTWLLINQAVAFNSPVWFNVGLFEEYGIKGTPNVLYRWNNQVGQAQAQDTSYRHPQCSACFIQSIGDDLMSIFELVKNEAKLFKFGSGTGTNFSALRSHHESLSGGGTSSGLMSFLKVFDSGAGATKSGGITRRAAKMVILNADHPEIFDFVTWKAKEEEKARILIEKGGLPADFNGEAYRTVGGQNSNNSVRVTDEFMQAVENDSDWQTTSRTSGEVVEKFKAKKLMDQIVESAWSCADPGMQFDTTINKWHTSKQSGRINGSNPCSEYMFLDDSACNLASINLVRFVDETGKFDIKSYRQAIRIFITAMEILVGYSSYPTATIAETSYKFRPLGLGYANIGTLLMLWGIPYDSAKGHLIVGALTAILTGHSYKTSAEIASKIGSFAEYKKNELSFLEVMRMHQAASYDLDDELGFEELVTAARQDWNDAVRLGEQYGYRNSQTTVIAPTGTIGLLMDCDTTGIEPAFSLIAFKKLAGGGSIKIVNSSVPKALENLGYSEQEISDIIEYIVGCGSLDNNSPINRQSLSEKGFSDDELDSLEKHAKGAFDISFIFNQKSVGSEVLARLGLEKDAFATPNFNFLQALGFSREEITQANKTICGHMMIENAPHINKEHLAVFDCANTNGTEGKRYIAPMGHVRTMAAAQPFISGAISKTVNMPNSASKDDIADIYQKSWQMGLKAISIYRDGSKHSQPLNTKTDEGQEANKTIETKIVYKPLRKRMPDERRSITHKFVIGNHKGYITIGLFDNNQPGEIFITMAKQGSVISGLMNSFATSISIALQYGVPLKVLVNKFIHSRFEPSGFTRNPQIQMAKSIVDYVFRYLALKFLSAEELAVIGLNPDSASSSLGQNSLNLGVGSVSVDSEVQSEDIYNTDLASNDGNGEQLEKNMKQEAANFFDTFSDAPACDNCGGIMTRSGTCYKCINCGSTSGCS